MGCPDADVIATYVENALAPDARREVERHADACAECRRLIAQLARFAAIGSGGQLLEITRNMRKRDALAATLPHALDTAAGPPPGSLMGRYIVLYRVGSGGMGIVLAAYDPELDRKVALKIVSESEDDSRELVREARALAKLAHENVVVVHDVGSVGGRVFIAMEFVDGGDLRAWLAAEPRSWREIVAMFEKAGRGLAASHRAGLVHRDFKPANVLVSTTGRVLVTDFGLARAAARASRPALDATGVVGTPAYMSPEQLAGEAADERSDQYSFCVSLYEALHGTRPYAGSNLDELADSIRSGVLVEPVTGTKVPAALRRALVRGLAKRRADRFASMDALLAAIERATSRHRARWLALGGVPLVAAGAIAVVALRGDAVCEGAQPKIDEVWNPAVQGQIERAFAAAHKPYAAQAWQAVKTALDRHAAAWVAMHTDACEATSVRREQSADVLDLRMQCLDTRRTQLAALVDILAHADARTVERASDAVGRLEPVAGCADLVALRSPVPLPQAPAVRAQIAELRGELARAQTLAETGKFRDGLAIAPRALAVVRSIGYQPLEAEALIVLGDLQYGDGDFKAAEASLRSAVIAAEASGHQLAAARAWRSLVVVLGLGRAEFAQALQAGDHARAIFGRLAPRSLDAAELEDMTGAVQFENAEYPAARAAVATAIAIYERELPPGDGKVTRAYTTLGNVEWREGHLDVALRIYERVREMVERLQGPAHPAVARAYGNISNVLSAQGKYEASLAASKHALAILESALGPQHYDLVATLNHMGNLAMDVGHYAEAMAHFGRALAIAEKAFGPEHPYVSTVLTNMSIVERRQHELARAREHLERAIRIDEKRLGPDNPELAATLASLTSLALAEGKLDEAKQLADRVLAIYAKAFGTEHTDVAVAYTLQANVASRTKHHRDAIAWLEKALAIDTKLFAPDDPRMATTLYNLGDAYRALGKLADAERYLRRGTAIIEAKTPDSPELADFQTLLAAILLELGRVKAAAPLAEGALAGRARSQVSPERMAETQDTLARILWRLPGGDRARAGELARKALAGYAGDDERRAELAAWMRSVGLRASP
jgi:eukaryotic-like serine/threonine-protein kinase